MKKRVVALLLSGIMVIGTLAGCGSTQQAVSEEKSTTSAVGQETDDAKEEVVEESLTETEKNI